MQAITEQAARTLMDEHAKGVGFRDYSVEFALKGLADAYAVQREFVRLQKEQRGVTPVGYKIGLTSARMQAMCGVDSPLAGVLLSDRVHRSGSTIVRADYGRLGVEFEIAVKLAKDLTGPDTTFDAVAAAVGQVGPGIEIIDDRAADYARLDALSLISDNSWNAGIVLGAFQTAWPDLAALEGHATQDGADIGRGHGRDVLNHPYHAVAWLADHLATTGERLNAGDIVMTGSIITTKFPTGPCRFRYELGALGSVEVSVT